MRKLMDLLVINYSEAFLDLLISITFLGMTDGGLAYWYFSLFSRDFKCWFLFRSTVLSSVSSILTESSSFLVDFLSDFNL